MDRVRNRGFQRLYPCDRWYSVLSVLSASLGCGCQPHVAVFHFVLYFSLTQPHDTIIKFIDIFLYSHGCLSWKVMAARLPSDYRKRTFLHPKYSPFLFLPTIAFTCDGSRVA